MDREHQELLPCPSSALANLDPSSLQQAADDRSSSRSHGRSKLQLCPTSSPPQRVVGHFRTELHRHPWPPSPCQVPSQGLDRRIQRIPQPHGAAASPVRQGLARQAPLPRPPASPRPRANPASLLLFDSVPKAFGV